MEEPANPKNSRFIEDLQKASEEIEAGFQEEKSISHSESKVKEAPKESKPPIGQEAKEKSKSPEKVFSEDLAIQAEEIAKEKKRLEEIQQNLEKNQKMIAEHIQELTTIQGEISRVLEGKKKIDEDLQRLREKNKKIFEELGNPDSFWFSNK